MQDYIKIEEKKFFLIKILLNYSKIESLIFHLSPVLPFIKVTDLGQY